MRLRAAVVALLVAVPLAGVGAIPAHATSTALTASFEAVPETHDGSTSFSFRLRFSEPVATSYKTLRDHAFTVAGGSVDGARRVEGRSDLWEITVEPAEAAVDTIDDDITVVLRATVDCGGEGAVCTSGGAKALSNVNEATITGPLAVVVVEEVVESAEQQAGEEEIETEEQLEEEHQSTIDEYVEPAVELADVEDLGDITAVRAEYLRTRFEGALAGDWRRYCFSVGEARQLKFGLRWLDRPAELYLETDPGDSEDPVQVVASSTDPGVSSSRVMVTVRAGTYCARVVAGAAGHNHFRLRHGTEAPDMAALEAREQAAAQAAQQAALRSLGGLRGDKLGDKLGDNTDDRQPRQGSSCPDPVDLDDDHDETDDWPVTAVDWPADTSTTSTVATHSSGQFCELYAEIEPAGDVDWHKIRLDGESLYSIQVSPAGVIDGELWRDAVLEAGSIAGIYTSDGVKLAWSDHNGRAFCVTHYSPQTTGVTPPCAGGHEDPSRFGDAPQRYFMPGATGNFFVAVGGNESPTGAYALTVTLQDDGEGDTEDDHAASPGDAAGTVDVGGSVTGEITDIDEQDWFAVNLIEGLRYAIDMRGTSSGGGTITTMWLRGAVDPDLNPVPKSTWQHQGRGTDKQMILEPTTTGKHHIVAQGAERIIHDKASGMLKLGTKYGLGTYTLSVRRDLPDRNISEPRNQDFPTAIQTKGVVLARLQTNCVTGAFHTPITDPNVLGDGRDRDWFGTELTAGRTYAIYAKGPSASYEGAIPILNFISDSSGRRVTGVGDSIETTQGSSWSFFVRATGIYYIQLSPDKRLALDNYDLCVTELPPDDSDDYRSDTFTTGRVAIGGTTSGIFEHDRDHDWFRTRLVEGTQYRIEVRGRGAGGTTHQPSINFIRDSDGREIPYTRVRNNQPPEDSVHIGAVLFTPAKTGEHFIAANTLEDQDNNHTYVVAVTEVPTADDDIGRGIGTTATATVDTDAEGNIETDGDTDWFKFETIPGGQYRIEVEGTGTDPLADPLMRLYNPNQNDSEEWRSNDDISDTNPNSRLDLTAGARDREIWIEVADNNNDGTGTYTVTVTVIDEFADNRDTLGELTAGSIECAYSSVECDHEISAELQTAGDVDWIRVYGPRGSGRLLIDFVKGDTFTETATLKVYNDEGAELATLTGEDVLGRYAYNYDDSDTDYLFMAVGSENDGTGTYTITVNYEDDYGNGNLKLGLAGEASDSTAHTELTFMGDTFEDIFKGGTTSVEVRAKINYETDKDLFRLDFGGRRSDIRIEARAVEFGITNPRIQGIYKRVLTSGDLSNPIWGWERVFSGDLGNSGGGWDDRVDIDITDTDIPTTLYVLVDANRTSPLQNNNDIGDYILHVKIKAALS